MMKNGYCTIIWSMCRCCGAYSIDLNIPNQRKNTDFFCQQLDNCEQNSLLSSQHSSIAEGFSFITIKPDFMLLWWPDKYSWILVGKFYLTKHANLLLRLRFILFFDRYTTRSLAKNLQWCRYSKNEENIK